MTTATWENFQESSQQRKSPFRMVNAVARELAATVRTAAYPIENLFPIPAANPISGRRPVVLVHGFLAHADVMKPLSRHLLEKGWPTVARVSYPSFGVSFDEIVQRIEAAVLAHSSDGPIDLVGHSLGGVACRAYLKAFGGEKYVRRFVALGTPFGGTSLFRLAPPPFRTVLDPRGPWVTRLSEGPERVPTTVIRARYDQSVLPPRRATFPGAREIVMDGFGHNGLL